MAKETVLKTRQLDLCTSCGICAACCPVGAVDMELEQGQFQPRVDEQKCIDCGLCLKVCPGIDLTGTGKSPFDKYYDNPTQAIFDGDMLECYTAHCRDEKMRANSVSGGIIVPLVTALLTDKKYDAAFLLDFPTFTGNSARLKAISDPDKALASAGSKYVPASLYEVIKALRQNDTARYIVVGTSCMLYGLKKYLRATNTNESRLLLLGLFCEKTLNYNFIKSLEQKYRKSGEVLVDLKYRTKEQLGWPGNVKLTFDSGRQLFLSKKVRARVKEYFQLNRCLYCLDKLNISSDIAVGDCYIKTERDKLGKSSIIVRTDKGMKILDEYSGLFEFKTEKISKIRMSQGLSTKRENLRNARVYAVLTGLFDKGESVVGKKDITRLEKFRRHISWGQNCNYTKIQISKYLTLADKALKLLFKKAGLLAAIIITLPILLLPGCLLQLFRKNRSGKNILIIGAGLLNKGAQAMTFTTVDQLKRRFPDKDFYLLSTADYEKPTTQKRQYAFKILPWSQSLRIRLLLGPFAKYSGAYESELKEFKQLFKDAAFVADISGYKLSSQWDIINSLGYLINIMIAKKKAIDYYILPQSIGPFDFSLKGKLILFPLFFIFLKYPRLIYLREKICEKYVKGFTRSNLRISNDIVLSNTGYNIDNIFTEMDNAEVPSIESGTVGIIPNAMLLGHLSKDKVLSLYGTAVEFLASKGVPVCLMAHSAEDASLCKELMGRLVGSDKVTLIEQELSSIELEKIISKCGFVICCRYHSAVHSYRNSVPIIVIGWASKYIELMKLMDQQGYYLDARAEITAGQIIEKIEQMLKAVSIERRSISQALAALDKENVFDVVTRDYVDKNKR